MIKQRQTRNNFTVLIIAALQFQLCKNKIKKEEIIYLFTLQIV